MNARTRKSIDTRFVARREIQRLIDKVSRNLGVMWDQLEDEDDRAVNHEWVKIVGILKEIGLNVVDLREQTLAIEGGEQ